MRKTVFMMLLAAVSSSAVAEWVKVGESDTQTATVYVDPATIREAGNTVEMGILFDLKKPEVSFGKPYMSMMRQAEYDCKEAQVRTLSVSFLSGNMGSGEVVSGSSEPGSWLPALAGSVVEKVWRIACGKR